MPATLTKPGARPLLAQAWSAIDGLDAMEAALATVTARQRAIQQHDVTDAEVQWRRSVVDQLVDGKPLPDDLGRQALAATEAARAANAEYSTLGQLAHSLRAQLESLRQLHGDQALNLLREHHDRLMAAATEADRGLGSVATAAAAIAADRVEAWRTIADLAERHDELRAAQRAVLTATVGREDTAARQRIRRLTDLDGHDGVPLAVIRNLGDFDPWRTELETGAASLTAFEWPAAEPVARLRWLTRDAVQTWLPSIDDLDAAADELQNRLAEARRGSTGQVKTVINRDHTGDRSRIEEWQVR